MKKTRQDILSTSFHFGHPLFFITLSAHPREWNGLFDYINKISSFRNFDGPSNQDIQDYDINFTIQYIVQKFRAIRAILSCKKYSFFGSAKFER